MNPVVENDIRYTLYVIVYYISLNCINNQKNNGVHAPQRAMSFFTTG